MVYFFLGGGVTKLANFLQIAQLEKVEGAYFSILRDI